MALEQRHKAQTILRQRLWHRYAAQLDDCGKDVDVRGYLGNSGAGGDMSGPADKQRHTNSTFMRTSLSAFHITIVPVAVRPIVRKEENDCIVAQPQLVKALQDTAEVVVDIFAHTIDTGGFIIKSAGLVLIKVFVGHLERRVRGVVRYIAEKGPVFVLFNEPQRSIGKNIGYVAFGFD